MHTKYITPEELNKWKSEGKAFHLIDVREDYEVETCNIGGEHIRMEEVIERAGQIPRDLPVVIHCKSGRRSEAVVHALQQKFGFDNLYSLEGGIIGWIDTVAPDMPRY